MNDAVIVKEETINKEKREWISEEMKPGIYTFQMQAVTIYGLESQVSFYKMTVVVPEK